VGRVTFAADLRNENLRARQRSKHST
jgi:hypothetical protein